MEKIVITGMGTINPLGHNISDTWQNIINGISGVAPITRFDASQWRTQIACEVKDFNPKKLSEKSFSSKPFNQQSGHSNINHGNTCLSEYFIVFTQTAVRIKPRKGSLYNPTSG